MERKKRLTRKLSWFTILVVSLVFMLLPSMLIGAVNISKSGAQSIYPRIAVDSRDYIHVVWVDKYSDRSGVCFYSMSSSQGSEWTTPVNLSNSSKAYCETRTICDVDVDSFNNVYAAWIEDENIKLRIRTGGEWGSVINVSSMGVSLDTVSLSVSTQGDIYLVWWSIHGIVYSRARVNNSWESTKVISNTGKRSKWCKPGLPGLK